MPSRRTREVVYTHPEKVFFPETGFTKGDMIRYYADIAPFLLPHLRDRPVTLIRFPDGIRGERFYEKNAPRFAPPWIRTFDVRRRHEEGAVHYIVIDDAATLGWCANLAAIELHPFLHRTRDLDRPTQVVFDLDPGEGADILDCTRVAFLVKAVLDRLSLSAFPKVSGSKGIQLSVPLNTPTDYAATWSFAKAVALHLERTHPGLVVSGMDKTLRRGHVMIDWSQNNASKTTVAAYSLRGKHEEPFVSLPVSWPELRRARKASALFFSPDDARRRLKKMGTFFAPVLTLKQRLPKAFAGSGAADGESAGGQAASEGADDGETAIERATIDREAAAKTGRARTPAALKRYGAKRDFLKTREPRPAAGKRRAGRSARFVIQKHAASHLHYDFRLEMDGTLKSWAVPKGPSTVPGIKRAAFEVEDHPIGYLDFEGTIPKGQYGGGTVMVWDIGTYDLLGGGHARGDLKLLLHGKKLKGEWHLFRIRRDEGKNLWLLAKAQPAVRPISARSDDRSALTGRSMAQIGAEKGPVWNSRR